MPVKKKAPAKKKTKSGAYSAAHDKKMKNKKVKKLRKSAVSKYNKAKLTDRSGWETIFPGISKDTQKKLTDAYKTAKKARKLSQKRKKK